MKHYYLVKEGNLNENQEMEYQITTSNLPFFIHIIGAVSKTITLGVTGPIAGGKGTTIEILQPLGFKKFSLSDEVRKEVDRRGLEHTRSNLQNVGNSLREEFGNNILAQRVSESIEAERKNGNHRLVVIDSLRNPGEIKWLKKHYNLKVIGITAGSDLRFKRVKKRATTGDPKTLTEFKKLEKRDRGAGESKSGQQVEACLKLADYKIRNTGTKADLKKKIGKIVSELEL